MSPCNEESSSGSASTSQSVIVTPAEGSTEEGPQNETKQMNPDNQALIPQADHEGANPSASPPEMSEVSDRYSSLVQLVQEGKNASVTPERTLLSSLRQPPSLPTGQGGSVPSGKAEKASVDGYNWRKYGQKNVKGNEFIRSYYKCTHPNCLVKKQVERSLKGQIIDTVYFGQHDHPKPHVKVPVAIGIVASIVEPKPEKASPTVIEGKPSEIRAQTCQQVMTTNTCLSLVVTASNDVKMKDMSPTSRSRAEFDNDDDHSSKRKKKENHGADAASVNKATGEARLIIQTMSEVDSVNDGYRWRKYGQKLVKGNPNPRSYYRCSSPGCPVKKHVERTSHDPKVVMTTYEGQHDHNMPAVRIVTRNSAGADGAAVARGDDEARTKSEECQAMCADAAERQDSSVRLNHLAEHQNNKSENKQDATGSTTPEHESKSNMQKKDEPLPHCKSQGEKDDPSDSGPRNMLTVWQPSSQLTAKPEESEGACINKVGKRSNEQEQVLNTAAAIQS